MGSMTLQEKIANFLAGAPHAVVGASRDRAKYGNKVLRVYLQNDRPVYLKRGQIYFLTQDAWSAELPADGGSAPALGVRTGLFRRRACGGAETVGRK
jgi:hypothetical protein